MVHARTQAALWQQTTEKMREQHSYKIVGGYRLQQQETSSKVTENRSLLH